MKIIPLSEGAFTVDKTKLFIPFSEDEEKLSDRSRGSLLVEVQPFVIITEKDILLLDTGLGFMKDEKLQLHQNLIDHGINASEITKVLLSHLHKDHSGGVGLNGQLSFPNATYYVQEKELAFAFEKGFPSFITEDIECLKNNERVQLLDGDGMIDNYIEYKVTGAHSPFHQVFWIKENNETIFFGADDAPQLQQMKHRFVAKYDFDGKKAMELRQEWWKRGHEEHWTFLFYHDITNSVYRL